LKKPKVGIVLLLKGKFSAFSAQDFWVDGGTCGWWCLFSVTRRPESSRVPHTHHTMLS